MSPDHIDPISLSDLKDLDYFFEEDGKLKVDPNEVPKIIDVHSHMGWSYAIGKDSELKVDEGDDNVKLWYNYTKDSDVVSTEEHPTKAESKNLVNEIFRGLRSISPSNETHTAKNLLSEMTRMNYDKACLSPIGVPLFKFGRKNVADTFRASQFGGEQLVPFAAVNLWKRSEKKQWEHLDELRADGARGVKYHPEFQFARPYRKSVISMFRWCVDRNVPVIAHTGHTGREPFFLKNNGSPKSYKKAFDKLKKKGVTGLRIVFAHSGLMKDYNEIVDLAVEYNGKGQEIWLETSGLTATALEYLLTNYPNEKIVFGSDWPFYPIAVSLARVLVATETHTGSRQGILHDNAVSLFGI